MPRPDRIPRLRSLVLAVAATTAAVIVLVAQGCSTTQDFNTQVDFYGPSGLAIAPARDRDLLFIASTGGDDLKAITICNTPSPADGGDPVTTCNETEDFHFLPGPIRVFPGSFPVGNRPVRLATANLRDVDGGIVGGVLVAGVAALVGVDGGVVTDGSDAGTVVELPALKLVDAQNVLDATQGLATIKVPADIPLNAPPIDVVSLQLLTGATPPISQPADAGPADAGYAPQPAFVLTQANIASNVPAEITALDLITSPDGPVATVAGRCSLTINASRLALIPGESDLLYVGDATTENAVAGGLGDGALEIVTAQIPPASGALQPCPINRRLVATDPVTGMPRGLTALALSPAYFTVDGRSYRAGAQMLGVSTDGLVVFIQTDLGVAPPIPPFTPVAPLPDGGPTMVGGIPVFEVVGLSDGRTAYVLPDGGVAPVLADGGFDVPLPGVAAQPMEPLRVNGLARDVAYLQTPLTCPANWPITTPCDLINVGASQNSYLTVPFGLVGLVTSTDGSISFIDADDRRFVSDIRDATAGSVGVQPTVDTTYSFSPAQPNGQAAPTLTFAAADLSSPECSSTTPPITCKPIGWSAAGVARQAGWSAVWHAQVPGLERQGGTLSREGTAQLRFTMPGVDTSRWTNPAIDDALDVNDVIAIEAYSTADPTATLCPALTNENLNPLAREFTITAIGSNYFILNPSAASQSQLGDQGFNPPDSCLSVGATVEVRYADGLGGKPWLIVQGQLIHGRAGMNTQFTATETRFDYPLQYVLYPDNPGLLPTIANDIGVAFTISGPQPVTAQSTLAWSIASGQAPTHVTDTSATGGFGGPIITYTSLKLPGNLVFYSSTGSNSVLQIDPSLIGVVNGILSYR